MKTTTTTVKNGFMVEQDDSIHVFETPQGLADFMLKWGEEQEIEGSKAEEEFKSEPYEKLARTVLADTHGIDTDGWIDWEGGDCPVDGDQMVEVKTDSCSGTSSIGRACGFIWDAELVKIIKYRIIEG